MRDITEMTQDRDNNEWIEQHLSICDECREEYEMLCVALGK